MNVLDVLAEPMNEVKHYPVMNREVLDYLDIKKRKIIIDCTLGIGSHALKFFEVMGKDAFLIGIDKDEKSLSAASQRLKPYGGRFSLIKSDFSQIDNVLNNFILPSGEILGKTALPDVLFLDLGISTYQLNDAERGFSFLKEGPLDMRMDRENFLCAYDLVNNLSEEELVNIFRKFGEERHARRIARFIVEARKRGVVSTTTRLAQIILQAVPYWNKKYRIHPATRIFQALRIAVNRELEALEETLQKGISLLKASGRIGVISFHSLEDRIVKRTFKDFASRGILKIMTKKPLVPAEEERNENIPSRSAKFRAAEKL